jgi:cytochrome b
VKRTDAVGAGASARVWDLPVRLFHWTLVPLIAFSWWSAENEQLEWHLWSGYGIMSLVLFRLLWGVFGSSTARFSSFVRGPKAVVGYMRDMRGWKPIGHTPLGALSVLALLSILILQVVTGLINADDDGLIEGPLAGLISYDLSDTAHDFHETLFDLLWILILLHVAAIIFYRLALGKRLLGPMITGRSAAAADTEPMRPGKWWVALICLALGIGITRWIIGGAPPFGS